MGLLLALYTSAMSLPWVTRGFTVLAHGSPTGLPCYSAGPWITHPNFTVHLSGVVRTIVLDAYTEEIATFAVTTEPSSLKRVCLYRMLCGLSDMVMSSMPYIYLHRERHWLCCDYRILLSEEGHSRYAACKDEFRRSPLSHISCIILYLHLVYPKGGAYFSSGCCSVYEELCTSPRKLFLECTSRPMSNPKSLTCNF